MKKIEDIPKKLIDAILKLDPSMYNAATTAVNLLVGRVLPVDKKRLDIECQEVECEDCD